MSQVSQASQLGQEIQASLASHSTFPAPQASGVGLGARGAGLWGSAAGLVLYVTWVHDINFVVSKTCKDVIFL